MKISKKDLELAMEAVMKRVESIGKEGSTPHTVKVSDCAFPYVNEVIRTSEHLEPLTHLSFATSSRLEGLQFCVLHEGYKENEDIIEYDPVNRPKHYNNHPSGVECIQITEHMGFNLGNAMKYIWRADLKNNAMEDLEKAVWYINRELEKRRKAFVSGEVDQ